MEQASPVSDDELYLASHYCNYAFAAYGYMLYIWSQPHRWGFHALVAMLPRSCASEPDAAPRLPVECFKLSALTSIASASNKHAPCACLCVSTMKHSMQL